MVLNFFPETTEFGPTVEISSLKFFILEMTTRRESVSETSWFEEKNHKMIDRVQNGGPTSDDTPASGPAD
jgi:hypothetical protein